MESRRKIKVEQKTDLRCEYWIWGETPKACPSANRSKTLSIKFPNFRLLRDRRNERKRESGRVRLREISWNQRVQVLFDSAIQPSFSYLRFSLVRDSSSLSSFYHLRIYPRLSLFSFDSLGVLKDYFDLDLGEISGNSLERGSLAKILRATH